MSEIQVGTLNLEYGGAKEGLLLPTYSSAVGLPSGVQGDLLFETDENVVMIYISGSGWVELSDIQ